MSNADTRPALSAFLSHASGPDDAWTRWVAAILAQLGVDVEVDYSSWPAGEQVADRISRAIDGNRLFVPLFSKSYFEEGRWTRDEIAAAWSTTKSSSLAIVPFQIEQYELPAMYSSLIARQLFDLTENAATRAVIDELTKRTRTAFEMPIAGRVDHPPYPGGSHRPIGAGGPRKSVAVDRLISDGEQRAQLITQRPDLNETHLGGLMFDTQSLARSYNYETPAKILALAIEPCEAADQAINAARHPQQMAELYFVLGRLHAVLSYATLDLGRPEAALRHALAVVRCADYAGHDELEAWGYGTASMILRFQSRNESSVDWALKGLALSGSGSSKARLHAQAALSYVELHRTLDTTEHLKQSEALVDDITRSPEMRDGIFLFSRAKHHYYAGSAYADFGPSYASEAVGESRAAIEGFQTGDEDTRSYSDELLAYVHLARGLYMSEQLDEIPTALLGIFESDPAYHTSWHIQWLDRFAVALNSGRTRGSSVALEVVDAAAEFRERSSAEGE